MKLLEVTYRKFIEKKKIIEKKIIINNKHKDRERKREQPTRLFVDQLSAEFTFSLANFSRSISTIAFCVRFFNFSNLGANCSFKSQLIFFGMRLISPLFS